ncbi:hypothetical protein WKK05_11390 [Nostoc sp. UHCC 0302]|uniref:hypothetical protein n=1 Tax=Nostoc sp. UHCC 0302 TaxID=3134896 RepID=UPI00311C9A72
MASLRDALRMPMRLGERPAVSLYSRFYLRLIIYALYAAPSKHGCNGDKLFLSLGLLPLVRGYVNGDAST